MVPVDLKSAPEHAADIFEASGAVLAIKTKYKESLPAKTIYLEDLLFSVESSPATGRLPAPGPSELAELVYTSGTTGDPKGVMITHRNLMSNVEAVIRRIDVNEGDCMLSVLPLSHLFEQTGGMLAPLAVGAAVVYLSTIKPSAIFRTLKNEPITIFLCVPRLLYSFKNGIKRKFSGPKTILFGLLYGLAKSRRQPARKKLFFIVHRSFNKRFRFFVSGGSYLDPDTENFWETLGFRIVQGYGLSECSPILAVNSENERRPGSIGRALDNVKLKLSAEGEILARGPNVFSGYYRDEEKTKQAFENGWFLTGDIALRDRDGFYYIKSRKKDIIVTAAGINVYPEEIESVLNERPEIKESAVVGLSGEQGEEVTAVIIPEKGKTDWQAIINEVNAGLDPRRQIAAWRLWAEPEFPKTTTLKIKKNLVRQGLLPGKKLNGDPQNAPPLVKILAETSRVPAAEIRPESLIYSDLKIDSIGRVELVSRIEQEFTLDFEEELINEKTTVGELDKMIKNRVERRKRAHFPAWAYGPKITRLRIILMNYLGLRLASHWCRVEARGLENLKNLDEPVIFAANHLSYFDQNVIMLALSRDWQARVATAAWEGFFQSSLSKFPLWLFKRCFYHALVLGFGIFPLSQIANFKKTLEFSGSLIDRGKSILIFPEGERSRSGSLLPLKKGLALMAQNLKVPIVPVKISGTYEIFPRGSSWPKPGRVTVSFGAPLRFSNQNQNEILDQVSEKLK